MKSATIDGIGVLPPTQWRKSSYSGGDNGSCIEVADGVPGVMPVRDSKDRGRSPLVFPVEAWSAFVGGLRAGALR